MPSFVDNLRERWTGIAERMSLSKNTAAHFTFVEEFAVFASNGKHQSSRVLWFDDNRKPPRWKQSVAIWLAFFPVSLAFNLGAGPYLGELSLAARVLLSTLVLTPLMTYWFIPLSSRLLAPWLHRRPQRAASLPEAH